MTEEGDATSDRVARLERRLARERAARRESERIAEDALRRLYEANELKTVLLGTVNHELRTPATIIMGFADRLDVAWDRLDEGRRRDIVHRISQAASRLATLVEETLGLAELEAANIVHRIEPVSVRALVEDTRHALGDQHELDLTADIEHVRGYPPALRRVLRNLFDNARMYSPPGTVVRLGFRPQGEFAVVTVVDEGPGVAVEERSRVFESFYRGSGDHVLRTSGLGIGLAVVRRLVGLHDGDVRMEAATSGGARVVVRLPLGGG